MPTNNNSKRTCRWWPSRPGPTNILLSLLFLTPVGAHAADKQAKALGESLFAESGCQHCHTIRANGGTKGPDLSGVGRRLNQAQLRTQILQGGRGMPAFADALDSTQTDNLIAYLRSCRDKMKHGK